MCWGIERVHALVDGDRFSFPRSWTSLAEEDAFVLVAKGRSVFRISDLLSLVVLLDNYEGGKGDE